MKCELMLTYKKITYRFSEKGNHKGLPLQEMYFTQKGKAINNFTRANTQVRPYVKYFIVGANMRICPLGNYLSKECA